MDDRHIEHAIFTSTLGSKRKSISQSSQGKDESYGRTLSILKSVHEKRGSLSVKEKRRLRWHQIRFNLERHSRPNGEEEAEVAADKPPKRKKMGKNSEISYAASKEEKERETRTISSFSAYQNDASPPRYPPLCSEANELKKDRSCSRNQITKQRFSGPLSRKTHEAGRPMQNTVGERYKEHATEVTEQTNEASWPTCNSVRDRDKEHATEESLVIPTPSDVNEEVSSYPITITSPPIDRPNGYSLQLQAHPSADPIWRGRLAIVNKNDETFEGFVAHLSKTACQPAIEEARLLPPLLQLEMVPKSTVWPKSFQTTKPTDYHIALYIFPSNTRFEKTFDLLVDHMSRRELAMRTFTKNAELLIFPSTELEMPFWRFQNKYYIWGVFRGKIRSPAILENM